MLKLNKTWNQTIMFDWLQMWLNPTKTHTQKDVHAYLIPKSFFEYDKLHKHGELKPPSLGWFGKHGKIVSEEFASRA